MTVQLQQRGEIQSALELQTIFTPICNYLQTTVGKLLLALVPLLVKKLKQFIDSLPQRRTQTQ